MFTDTSAITAHAAPACGVGSSYLAAIRTLPMAVAGAGSGDGMQTAGIRRRDLQQDLLLPSGQEVQVEGAGVPPGAVCAS